MASKPSYTLSTKVNFAYTLITLSDILLSVIIGINIEKHDSIKYSFVMFFVSAAVNMYTVLLHIKPNVHIPRRFIEIMIWMIIDAIFHFIHIIFLTKRVIDIWQLKLSLAYSTFHCLFSLSCCLYCMLQPKLF